MSPMNDRPWMSDDDARGGRGGASRWFSRVFENPENPLGWSLKLFTVGGITVRLHLLMVVYIVVKLLWSIPEGNAGLMWTAIAMGILFLIVLLHEFGHCYACRLVGGEADRIVMLPWGGLALCRPPHDWRSNFITTFGGPAVNLILIPVTMGLLALCGLQHHIAFNPFNPWATLSDPDFNAASTAISTAKVALWWFHYINLVILAFNLLLVFVPFDGGRMFQELIWKFTDYRRSMSIAIPIGFAGASLIVIFGLVSDRSTLVTVGAFGLLACWMERRRLRGEFDLGDPSYAPGSGTYIAVPVEGDEYTRLARKQAKAREQAAKEQAEIDRILAKIADEGGMGSLSRRERKFLEAATKKKRGE
ncbi:MAG TPA: site-2 protease family protein [Phycisphaerales bacterium]|nr:site-2 protease family protein [Phycisphaerales bacterium]